MITRVIAIAAAMFFAAGAPVSAANWEELLTRAASFLETQQYDSAIVVARQALREVENTVGVDPTSVAAAAHALGVCHYHNGEYAEAEPLYKRALEIYEKALGPEHPDLATNLNNLARLYQAQGRYAEAEPLHKRALAIREKALGPEHPDVAASLNNLALLYRAQGRYAEAEPLYKRALAIDEKALSPDHPGLATDLNNLASLYQAQGRYAEAEPLHKRALSIVTKAQTSRSLWATVLETYSRVLRSMGEYVEATNLAAQAHARRWEDFVSNSATLSERDALKYSNSLYWSTSNYLSCYSDLGSSSDSVTRRTADMILASKGLVSDDMFERQKALIEETDSATLVLAQSVKSTRFQLSDLYMKGPGDDMKSSRHRLDSLSRIVCDLEADLARRSASYRKRQDYHHVSAERISSLIPAGVTLVEYIRYYHRQLDPEEVVPRYLALVMTSNDIPRIVDLGSGYEIDNLVGEYRAHILRVIGAEGTTPALEQEYTLLGRELYARVWQPIAELIGEGGSAMVAPDGALNIVSFAGLPDNSGRFLIEKNGLHHLSSGRDLIRLQDRPQGARGLLAMGDPDYDAGVSSRLHAADRGESGIGGATYASRAVPSRFGEFQQVKVDSLPATRREVELIVDSWHRHTDEPAVAYFDSAASEEMFKTQCAGHRVLHLATHGFFMPPRFDPAAYDSRRDTTFEGENPLLLLGLSLAGANRHGTGADTPGAEDGILTAYEVSSLDLKGTELVVLSACETGLGEVKEGEGVYGLRRAFQMVGVGTVISALWPVSDSVTAETMSQLHDRGEQTLSDRLRELQLEAVAELRARGESDHPISWAAFIAIGDWR